MMIEQINALLPQTQCGQCGFKGCRPYAEAMPLGLLILINARLAVMTALVI